MNIIINQLIDELLKAEDQKLTAEAEALMLAAKMCNEGHPLPSESFLSELAETIKDRRVVMSETPTNVPDHKSLI